MLETILPAETITDNRADRDFVVGVGGRFPKVETFFHHASPLKKRRAEAFPPSGRTGSALKNTPRFKYCPSESLAEMPAFRKLRGVERMLVGGISCDRLSPVPRRCRVDEAQPIV